MSLFGAMTTAISGLNAQSKALGNISDNVANSQTIGFKRVDTSFVNYLTTSSQKNHSSGSVVARPDYSNSSQGTIEQSENPLNMAIAGQGFFPVSLKNGDIKGQPTFDDRTFYTRAGDFTVNKEGYLVNGSGYFLQGWSIDGAGNVDRTHTSEIRVSDTVYNPVPTSEVTMNANLPDSPTNPVQSSQVQIYDSLGTLRTVNLTWTQNAQNKWTLSIDVPDDVNSPARGTVDLNFGVASANSVPAGTVGDLVNATGSVTTSAFALGDPTTATFTADFGNGPQTISLNLGTFGTANGITQFAGKEYSVRSLSQNGVPFGSFSSLGFHDNGDVVVNYDNGQSRTIARVPVVVFNDPDSLQRQDGQAFTRTMESGEARILDTNNSGAGKLIVSSIERSNVDIATEFTKLIVAQRAYSANTRIVTTSDELLQETLNMKR